MIQWPRTIKQHQQKGRLLQPVAGTLHADRFDRISSIADAGSVRKPQQHVAQPYRFFHDIAGGSRDGGNDAAFTAGQAVHQGGFSHIRAADDHGVDAFPYHSAGVKGIQQPFERVSG